VEAPVGKKRHRRYPRQRGSGYLEFLIVAPILLLVAGSTIELARFIKLRQIADVISKEAALEAYRQCDITNIDAGGNSSSDPTVNTTTTTNETQACLDDVASKFQATIASTGVENARVVLSLYRYDFGFLIPRDAPTCTAAPNSFLPPITFTRITTGAIDSAFRLVDGVSIQDQNNREVGSSQIGCRLGRILISELAFFYDPIIDFRVLGIGDSFDVNFNESPLRRDPGANFQNAFRETTIL
jgi:Flp pilus assembly protein TadG